MIVSLIFEFETALNPRNFQVTHMGSATAAEVDAASATEVDSRSSDIADESSRLWGQCLVDQWYHLAEG